jgi:hypothetical protein
MKDGYMLDKAKSIKQEKNVAPDLMCDSLLGFQSSEFAVWHISGSGLLGCPPPIATPLFPQPPQKARSVLGFSLRFGMASYRWSATNQAIAMSIV